MCTTTLPIHTQVVDAATGKPVPKAEVELQWRTGYQGYYWGKSVTHIADDSGKVSFASADIPLVSSDGYSLGKKPLKKVFVSCLLVSAEGYEKLKLMNPENFSVLKLKAKETANNAVEATR